MDMSRFVVVGFSLLILVSIVSGVPIKSPRDVSHQFTWLLILVFLGMFIYSIGSAARKQK